MRSRILGAGAVLVLGFLLVTNPVVADAAKQITGKQIKNGTVTGKDVKDRSLRSADFADGQLPSGLPGPTGATGPRGPQGLQGVQGPAGPSGPVVAVSSPLTSNAVPAGSTVTFLTTAPTPVTVTAGQRVVASITGSLATTGASTTVSLALCHQPAAGGPVTAFDPNGYHSGTTLTGALRLDTVSGGSGALPAGDYVVGMCILGNSTGFTGAGGGTGWFTGFVQVAPAAAARPDAFRQPSRLAGSHLSASRR